MRNKVENLTPDLDLSSENADWPSFWRAWISLCNSASTSRDCVDRAGAPRAEAESGVRACNMQGMVVARSRVRSYNMRNRQMQRKNFEKRCRDGTPPMPRRSNPMQGIFDNLNSQLGLHSPTQRPSILHTANGRVSAQHVDKQQLVARLYRGSNSV